MAKVNGGALIYSLFIVLVLGTFLTLVLMISQYSAQNVVGYQRSIQQQKNLDSGIELLLNSSSFQKINTEKEHSLFSDTKNTILTKRISWGLYEVIGVTQNNTRSSKFALVGQKPRNEASLYLTNTNKTLKLAGNTKLEGVCFLPEKGVERANISSKPYTGEKLIYGKKETSKKSLPELKNTVLNSLTEQKSNDMDSTILWNEYFDSIQHSFKEKTAHYISSSTIQLFNQKISGNIILESTKSIFISAQSRLNNVIVKAPYIYVEDSFNGTLQLQATDSIILGENVKLGYPSSIFIHDNHTVEEKSSCIKVGKNTTIQGEVLAVQKEYNYRDKISLQLAHNVSIMGSVYINGVIKLNQTLFSGSVYCHEFLLKTGGTNQSNTLLDVTISNKYRSEKYLGSEFLKSAAESKKSVINWLE